VHVSCVLCVCIRARAATTLGSRAPSAAARSMCMPLRCEAALTHVGTCANVPLVLLPSAGTCACPVPFACVRAQGLSPLSHPHHIRMRTHLPVPLLLGLLLHHAQCWLTRACTRPVPFACGRAQELSACRARCEAAQQELAVARSRQNWTPEGAEVGQGPTLGPSPAPTRPSPHGQLAHLNTSTIHEWSVGALCGTCWPFSPPLNLHHTHACTHIHLSPSSPTCIGASPTCTTPCPPLHQTLSYPAPPLLLHHQFSALERKLDELERDHAAREVRWRGLVVDARWEVHGTSHEGLANRVEWVHSWYHQCRLRGSLARGHEGVEPVSNRF
jgi:hypothetical protein